MIICNCSWNIAAVKEVFFYTDIATFHYFRIHAPHFSLYTAPHFTLYTAPHFTLYTAPHFTLHVHSTTFYIIPVYRYHEHCLICANYDLRKIMEKLWLKSYMHAQCKHYLFRAKLVSYWTKLIRNSVQKKSFRAKICCFVETLLKIFEVTNYKMLRLIHKGTLLNLNQNNNVEDIIRSGLFN